MLKKYWVSRFCVGFLTALTVLAMSSGTALASVLPPNPGGSGGGLLFGQNHTYSVVFRGNGEAIVYGRMAFTNTEAKLQTDFVFSITGAVPSDLVFFQQILPQRCVRFDYARPGSPCLEWQDSDYTQSFYYDASQPKYHKSSYQRMADYYSVQLPVAIQPEKAGAILFAYAARGYVEEQLGLFKYNFITPSVNARIEKVLVGVDVDSDLAIKDKKSSVNYFEAADVAKLSVAPVGGASSALDRLSQQIGMGAITKEAKGLAPGDTFKVSGSYANSTWRLYLGSILWSAAFLIVLIFFLVWLMRHLRRQGLKSAPGATPLSMPTAPVTRAPLPVWLSPFNLGMSLLSAGLVTGLTIFMNWFMRLGFIINLSNGGPVLQMLLVIIFGLLFVLAIIGPAALASQSRGGLGARGAEAGDRSGSTQGQYRHWDGRSFVAVLVGELIWLIIFMVVYAVIFGPGEPNYRTYGGYVEDMMQVK